MQLRVDRAEQAARGEDLGRRKNDGLGDLESSAAEASGDGENKARWHPVGAGPVTQDFLLQMRTH